MFEVLFANWAPACRVLIDNASWHAIGSIVPVWLRLGHHEQHDKLSRNLPYNVNPGWINPGWLIVVVPQTTSSWCRWIIRALSARMILTSTEKPISGYSEKSIFAAYNFPKKFKMHQQFVSFPVVSGPSPLLGGKFTMTLCFSQCNASYSSHLVPLSCAQTDVVSAWPLIEWMHLPIEICNSCNPVTAMTSCGCDETEKGRSTVHHCLRHSRVEITNKNIATECSVFRGAKWKAGFVFFPKLFSCRPHVADALLLLHGFWPKKQKEKKEKAQAVAKQASTTQKKQIRGNLPSCCWSKVPSEN